MKTFFFPFFSQVFPSHTFSFPLPCLRHNKSLKLDMCPIKQWDIISSHLQGSKRKLTSFSYLGAVHCSQNGTWGHVCTSWFNQHTQAKGLKAFTWEGPTVCLTIIPQFSNSEGGSGKEKEEGWLCGPDRHMPWRRQQSYPGGEQDGSERHEGIPPNMGAKGARKS